jgi:hypothetical protein
MIFREGALKTRLFDKSGCAILPLRAGVLGARCWEQMERMQRMQRMQQMQQMQQMQRLLRSRRIKRGIVAEPHEHSCPDRSGEKSDKSG